MWASYFPILYSNRKNVLWKVIDNSLCVFQKSTYSKVNEYEKNWSMAFLPMPFNYKAFENCVNLLCKLNKLNSVNVHNISNTDMDAIHSKINCDATFAADGKDYIYDVSCSKSLTGPDYKKIRYYVKHFERDYSPQVEKYDPSMYKECFKLTKDWMRRKLEKDDTILYKEHTKEMLKELWMFDDMFGIAVRVKGELVAFSLGGILLENRQTGTCIIRKTVDGMKGLSEFIDWNFYNYLPQKINYVNDGDDCMSPSLADYKMKWRPAKIQPIFKGTVEAQ
ncbi:Uncharacterised protein [uncultured archaeon]|nr:Uncharacterised protein [uncultured archaeon]